MFLSVRKSAIDALAMVLRHILSKAEWTIIYKLLVNAGFALIIR